jgi:hypothetical protein
MLPILALVAAPVAALLGYAATRPGTLRVERSTTIAAPPERILPLLQDFRRWMEWSPWEKLDPDMKRTYGGEPTGIGATYAWEGRKAGAGRMKITQATPFRVTFDLHFEKPFRASNIGEFTLQSAGGATAVTWSMDGPRPFVSKLMGVFVNMDRLIGKDFEAGLASLKSIAEA